MRIAFLLAVCLLAGCDSNQAANSSVEITDQSTILLGETAVVDGVSVTFVDVEQDSRCPDHAVCVWEGIAIVALDMDAERVSVRVVDPEENREAGVRIGDRVVFATALTGTAPEEDTTPRVTVATVAAD